MSRQAIKEELEWYWKEADYWLDRGFNPIKNWWRNEAQKPELREGFNYAFWVAYFLMLAYNFVNLILQKNIEAVMWVGISTVWFTFYILTQNMLKHSQKLSRECIDGWQKSLDTWDINMKSVLEELEVIKKENNELRYKLRGTISEVSPD